MKKTRLLLTTMILLGVLTLGLATAVQAAPSLKWNTDTVYYEANGNLVLEGYFYNDGTRVVNWVKTHKVQVYFKTKASQWWLQTEATFTALNVYLRPGETGRWTLRITNVDYAYFEYWNVSWQTDYTYL